jgi:isopenicillin N synthase-like dioxygenase
VAAVSEQRYAFPLFFNVDYATRVEPLPELCQGGARYAGLIAGEHLLAQTVQTFRYLREQAERGELALPVGARELSSFGRERAPG